MALWKPFRGNRTALNTVEKHDGYIYFCIDDGSLFFDYTDADGVLQRKQINAKEAEALTGYSISTILNSSDLEIPTSKAVLDALAQKSQVQMITPDESKVLSTLKIHRMSQEEYDQALENGTIDEDALYLTPEEEIDWTQYATVDQLNGKADAVHSHDDTYYTEGEIDTLLSGKSDTGHNHSGVYAEAGHNHNEDYAAIGHNHEGVYAETGHNHEGVYAPSEHNHDDTYYKKGEVDTVLAGKSDTTHNHDSSYDAFGSASAALGEAKTYTDNAVAQKSQVQFIIWEEND